MRDIQLVLERWGAWAANDNSQVDWSPIAAGFKGLLPSKSSLRLSCCDDDGLIIDSAVGKLKQVFQQDELDLLFLHYVYCVSKRSIARKKKISEGRVRQRMQVAEGFVRGCLEMIGAKLDMDDYIVPKLTNPYEKSPV
jgi:hypothetical protein